MRFLVCTDGGVDAEPALHLAAQLSVKLAPSSVTLLGVRERDDGSLMEHLIELQSQLQAQGVETSAVVRVGDPVRHIVEETSRQSYDLTVLGGARRQGRFLARAAKLFQLAPRVQSNLLLAGTSAQLPQRILLCLGGSNPSRAAERLLAPWALATAAQVELFHVLPPPPALFESLEFEEDVPRFLATNSGLARNLQRHQRFLEEAGVPTSLVVRYGEVLPELHQEIRTSQADMLVIGGQAPSRWRSLLLGDVTRQIVAEVDRPILIVRLPGTSRGLLEGVRSLASQVWARATQPARLPAAPSEPATPSRAS